MPPRHLRIGTRGSPRFRDVSIASALQAFLFILRAGERGYRNDWKVVISE
jgi:hypothetical protein